MDYREVLYWVVIADHLRTFFKVWVIIFTIISVGCTVTYYLAIGHPPAYQQSPEDEYNQAMSRKWMWWSYPFTILFWALFILTPSKQDIFMIIAGGETLNYLTNEHKTKEVPKEITTFVIPLLKKALK